jgi:uncharacterized membrane protein YeaQ/YmgE (transglycosylase-associated protein family)
MNTARPLRKISSERERMRPSLRILVGIVAAAALSRATSALSFGFAPGREGFAMIGALRQTVVVVVVLRRWRVSRPTVVARDR